MNQPARDLSPHKFADTSDPPFLPASFPAGRRWYCVVTCCKAEAKAKMGLEALGFETFFPVMIRKVVRSRRVVRVARPLFPRYGFVRFDINLDGWYEPMMSTERTYRVDGVEELLNYGPSRIPAAVPDVEINKLRIAESAGKFDYTKHAAPFKDGQDVRITEGPFSGFIAKVRSASAKKRVEILLSLFGRGQLPLKIPAWQLEKI